MKQKMWISTVVSLFIMSSVGTMTVAKAADGGNHAQKLSNSVSNSSPMSASRGSDIAGMRKFPYPYRAMLAISSDADHETLRKFNLAHQFLNTTEQTPMGKGLGLDISDSFFMYNGSNLPTYTDENHTPLSDELTWFKGTSNTPSKMSVLSAYIKDGWIDTLHSYGDFSMRNQSQTLFTRKLAIQAIQSLKDHGDVVTVWTDHGNKSNVDDFGNYGTSPFYTYQQGAKPTSPYYHTDLLVPYGVKFVWADGHSNVFGAQSLVYPLRLADGRKVWGFNRYTDTGVSRRGVVQWVWSIDEMPKELSQAHLHEIITRHDYSIVATHFSADNNPMPFSKNAVRSLQLLQKEYKEGNILVARTSRLLAYNVVQQYLRYQVTQSGGRTIIDIQGVADPVVGWWVPTVQDLHGITFYTPDPKRTLIEIAGHPVASENLQENPSDGTGPSIGFTWFKVDTTDYSVRTYQPSSHLSGKTKQLSRSFGNTEYLDRRPQIQPFGM